MALLKDWEPGIFQGGTCLRMCRSTKFTTKSLGHAEQIADSGHQHLLQLGPRQTPVQDVGEVLDHDDGLGARIFELVFQFARVYSGLVLTTTMPRAAREKRDGILQDVLAS